MGTQYYDGNMPAMPVLHTHSARIYADAAYDKYFTLKPPPPLWLAILFLSREITLPLCMGIAHVAGVDNAALSVIRQLWSLDFSMVPAVFAATLLYLFFRRVPTASRAVRWLWAHGRTLVVISAIADVAVGSVKLMQGGEINDVTALTALMIGLDFSIVGYCLASQRVRDTFAEFPVLPAP